MKFNLRTLLALLIAVSPLSQALSEDKLSVEDLGFEKTQIQGDANLQARLEKRSRMLKTHQTLGLITAIPMIAAFSTGGGIKNSESKRDLHAALGLTAAGMYFTTAYFSIFAPEVEGAPHKGATKIHRALAFVHFPLMVLTPIAGLTAKRQLDKGEAVHGIGKLHPAIAVGAASTFFISMTIMVINF